MKDAGKHWLLVVRPLQVIEPEATGLAEAGNKDALTVLRDECSSIYHMGHDVILEVFLQRVFDDLKGATAVVTPKVLHIL